MLSPPLRTVIASTLLLAANSLRGAAQQDTTSIACAGELVSRVEIQSSPPPFGGAAKKWQAAAHAVGLHHATTRPEVVAAFLSLAPDRPCTEFRRAESERVLRTQRFLSDAAVRVRRDTGGRVSVFVTTTDEVPVLLSGRFRGVMLESFGLGNENLGGEALLVQAHVERGGAYRPAVGGRIQRDVLFGHAYRLTVDADRFQVGQRVSAELEHPIFTDLQRVSWHAGFVARDDYMGFVRPALDPLALRMTDRSWDASTLLRLFGTHTVALLGGAVTGRQFEPAAAGTVISDTGFRADTGVALLNRYSLFHSTRIGIIGGLRRVSFRSESGFDALVGSQDVASGALLGLFVAKGVPRLGESDDFLSGALYAGASSGNALIATLASLEGRRDGSTREWDSVIGSARTAFYWGSAPGVVLVIADEISGGAAHSRLPLQVTFDDRDGGLMGYHNSGLAGATRNVTRAELRWSAESVVRRADIGFATFGEAGTLWAGSAPYGVNATRASAGVSLLAAYPTRSKRLYRVDLAIPFTRSGTGNGRVEVRFGSADRTQAFWTEPSDVARARTGTEPSRLFAWPTH